MKYRANDARIFSDVTDGIAILIDMSSGVYYGLNLLTTNIYENIIAGVDTDALYSALTTVKGFNEEIGTGYSSFLQELIALEFIVEEDTPAVVAVHLSFDEFTNDELDFVLSAYPDASELLLADPIHQVKEEQGWMPGKEALK